MLTESQEKKFYRDLPDLSGMDAEEAAQTLYEYLQEWAEKSGQNPDAEVLIFEPGERTQTSGGNWWVVWEAGPYNWGINYTLDGRERTYAGDWYGEPYYGFDVVLQET